MGFRNSLSSVEASLASSTVLQHMVKKTLALESENSKLRHHVLVLSRRLHEVLVELRKRDKIAAAFCPFCGGNYNQVDSVFWEQKETGMLGTDFGGVVDVAPMAEDEEVANVDEEKKIVVRLPVAVAGSVANRVVAEDVALVEKAKGKEVAVVAEKGGCGVGYREEDWTVVRRKVREKEAERKRREIEERDAVQKRMNVWRPARAVDPNVPLALGGMRGVSVADSGYGSPGPSVGKGKEVEKEGVERVGSSWALRTEFSAPRELVAYRGVVLGSERRPAFGSFRSVLPGVGGSVGKLRVFAGIGHMGAGWAYEDDFKGQWSPDNLGGVGDKYY